MKRFKRVLRYLVGNEIKRRDCFIGEQGPDLECLKFIKQLIDKDIKWEII